MSSPSTPFEWLSGGLLSFGIGEKNKCDISSLIQEADEKLTKIVEKQDSKNNKSTTPNDNEAVEGGEKLVEKEKQEEQLSAEQLAASISRIRFLLYDERTSPDTLKKKAPPIAGSVVEGLLKAPDLLPRLLTHMIRLPFECRKDIAAMFTYLLVCGLDGADAPLYYPAMMEFVHFIEENYDKILMPLIRGHTNKELPDVVLHCGSMFRSILRHLSLYRQLMVEPKRFRAYIFPFLDTFVHSPNFDVSSDATESLRLVLTGGDIRGDEVAQNEMMQLASACLINDYEEIFDMRFNPKLLNQSSNYMTRRMALQILSTVLLTRSYYAVMIRYIASKSNLILVMHLIRDKSPHITLDAFHVFKIFVANPNKSSEIIKILVDNKVKLCNYLETLHKEREQNDTQFRDEKALVIATLQSLEIQ